MKGVIAFLLLGLAAAVPVNELAGNDAATSRPQPTGRPTGRPSGSFTLPPLPSGTGVPGFPGGPGGSHSGGPSGPSGRPHPSGTPSGRPTGSHSGRPTGRPTGFPTSGDLPIPTPTGTA
ncbi:hypothetical protein GGR53DRAFT_468358 [Hypoxylon sp. FL1150]|nr:hypothetical protein GGR53DRAFT_468358 [Hypoxylon sp. FL1150]